MNIERLKELFEQEDNITRTAKLYCIEQGIEFSDSLRRKVSNLLRDEKVDNNFENSTDTNNYSNNKETSHEK